jgi:mono/diheme cytochrome c family protein
VSEGKACTSAEGPPAVKRSTYERSDMRKSISLAAITIPLLASSAFAADPDHGETVVKRWCADCHMVAAGQKASTEAPPFSGIAKRPDFDASRIAFFLLDPHPKMPDMHLSRADVADIAAYIATLK